MMKELSVSDVIRIHTVAMKQLIPAIKQGIPYSQQLLQACWLAYEIGLIADDRKAQAPEILQDFSRQMGQAGALEHLQLARPWKRYVTGIINAAHDAKSPGDLKLSVGQLRQPSVSNDLEQFLADLLPEFVVSSAETAAHSEADEGGGGDSGEGGIDWGEVVEEDVVGVVGGAISGFAAVGIVVLLGGPAGGGAAAGGIAAGAAIGAVMSSGRKYLEEDAVLDAAEKVSSGGGGNPWAPGEGGDDDWHGWHDGDGYGLG